MDVVKVRLQQQTSLHDDFDHDNNVTMLDYTCVEDALLVCMYTCMCVCVCIRAFVFVV